MIIDSGYIVLQTVNITCLITEEETTDERLETDV